MQDVEKNRLSTGGSGRAQRGGRAPLLLFLLLNAMLCLNPREAGEHGGEAIEADHHR